MDETTRSNQFSLSDLTPRDIVQIATTGPFIDMVHRANWIVLPSLAIATYVPFGLKGVVCFFIGEGLATALGKNFASKAMMEEHDNFINKNWTAISTEWPGFDWHTRQLGHRPLVKNGRLQIMPMDRFPTALKRKMLISAFRASARAGLLGAVYEIAQRVVRRMPSRDAKL